MISYKFKRDRNDNIIEASSVYLHKAGPLKNGEEGYHKIIKIEQLSNFAEATKITTTWDNKKQWTGTGIVYSGKPNQVKLDLTGSIPDPLLPQTGTPFSDGMEGVLEFQPREMEKLIAKMATSQQIDQKTREDEGVQDEMWPAAKIFKSVLRRLRLKADDPLKDPD